MKHIFIINTIAGRGRYQKILPNIEKVCKEENIDYEIRYITKELNGVDIVKEYENEENIIYIVGGDGTLTKALQGIVGTKNKLGIIPVGSGNDTYKAIKVLPEGETKIDLAKINSTYFINVACSGIDAEVGHNMEYLRKTKIPISQLYNASIVYTFVKFKFKNIKIKTKIKEINDKYTIVSICNGGYYGGGYNIAPKSQLTDGLLDIYYVEKMSKIKMLPLILKLKKGKHEGKRRVHKFRANHVDISLDEETIFNIDGEKLIGKDFAIDIIPQAITIYNNNILVDKIMKNK